MITFIRGIVYSFGADYVVLDNNGIGYYIYFAHPEVLTLGQEITIFTYQHFREDATVLYGFINTEEQSLFNKLISVKGLGPKTAIGMLGVCNYNHLIKAIEEENLTLLKKMPSVGAKTAQQIILDLKGKLVADDNNTNKKVINQQLENAIEGLKGLGFKNNEINLIVNDLKKLELNSVDEYLKEGLKLLAKRKGV